MVGISIRWNRAADKFRIRGPEMNKYEGERSALKTAAQPHLIPQILIRQFEENFIANGRKQISALLVEVFEYGPFSGPNLHHLLRPPHCLHSKLALEVKRKGNMPRNGSAQWITLFIINNPQQIKV
jgi:hypothetical protein